MNHRQDLQVTGFAYASLLPWMAAGIGIALSSCIFYPGYLSWDSAYQWWQVRHGVIDPAHPPIMVWAWSLTNHLLPGPGGYFLLQQCLYWLSLALFVSAIRVAAFWQAALVLVVGFWPPLWGLSLHLWKDVGTLSFFCLAVACFAWDLRRPHVAWRAGAFIAIVLACAYRLNALSAALPLLVYGVARQHELGALDRPLRKIRPVLLGGLACVLVQVLISLPNQLLKLTSEPLWPMAALWDIAAVSIEEDRLLFPTQWVYPELTIDLLRQYFNPVYSGRVFQVGLIRLNPDVDLSEDDFRILRNAWLLLPVKHPSAYWRHRFRLMKTLLGWQHDPDYASLVFHTAARSFKDNPEVVFRADAIRIPLEKVAHQYSWSPLFQGGWYLLLTLATLWIAARRHNALMSAVAASGLLYVLPLLVLAPSADFRYLAWMIQAGLLALLLSRHGVIPPTPPNRYRI